MNQRETDLSARVGPDAATALKRFRRRVLAGVVVGAAAEGIGAVALLAAAAVLVARTFGLAATPAPWWAAGLAVPAAWVALRVRRAVPTAADAALHLDRRLGLEGLLLSSLEGDAASWRDVLSPRVRRLGDALPRVRWGRAAARAALPLAALLGVLLLPPPSPESGSAVDPALARALDRFERRFDEIARHEGLREEARKDIEERVKALEARREKGEAISWADVDAAEEKMDREAKQRAAALSKAKAGAAAFGKDDHADVAEARQEMAALLEDAAKAGLADDVPAGVAGAAGLGKDGKFDPKTAEADAAALAALAKALEGTAGERLDALAQLGVADLKDLAALEKLMKGDPIAGRLEEGACLDCRGDNPGG